MKLASLVCCGLAIWLKDELMHCKLRQQFIQTYLLKFPLLTYCTGTEATCVCMVDIFGNVKHT